jgi:hypothetical protein
MLTCSVSGPTVLAPWQDQGYRARERGDLKATGIEPDRRD